MTENDALNPDRPKPSGQMYRHPPLRHQGRAKAIEDYWSAYSDVFDKESDMVSYLDALTMPASGAWVYGRIPKTGTHTVLAALQRLEFGTDLTAVVHLPNNASENMAPHMLDEAGIFMSPLQAHHRPSTLDQALRFTIVRDPVKRAVSSFLYLSRSHEIGARQFAPTRLRMSALIGFNWNTDPYTAVGLEKMMRFVEASTEFKRFKLDRHIAPQTSTLNKDVFAPYMTGRTEELARFVPSLADELGVSGFRSLQFDVRNSSKDEPPFIVNRRLRSTIETVYSDDMNWYNSV